MTRIKSGVCYDCCNSLVQIKCMTRSLAESET